ncbi:hypothetical protein [Streptomyces sporangiiformans]|uniref:DUF2867 domain-containing protein n=1 Tax=Streptomyces sporangiiformans TaxID=2315329 RepID=A0A505CUG7_9ACTN|nr:hypothetical protein [Streptomyces sporangiiformans]TPQ15713.1 hypothetical protein FGD71_045585 [Streptomyces sporangiiformans]
MNADSTVDLAGEPLLLDGALPEFGFSRLECVALAAAPPVAYEAARGLDLLTIHAPLLNAAVWARGLPERLRGRSMPTPPSLRVADLFDTAGEAWERQPWVALGENPGRELVFGAVGKPWRASIEWRRVEPEHFTSFDEAGWAKMAAAFVVHPYGNRRSLLTYEARTACTDPASAARFGRYWTLVSPGIGVVLRGALRAVSAAAEQVSRHP